MLIAHLHAPENEYLTLLTLLTLVETLPQRGPVGPELPWTQTSKGVPPLPCHHQLWAFLVRTGTTAACPLSPPCLLHMAWHTVGAQGHW